MENQNINQNVMPELRLFPCLEILGRFIKHCVSFCPLEAPNYLSTHYREAPLDTPIEPVTGWGPSSEKYCVLGIIPTSEWKEE